MKRLCLFAGYDKNNIIHDYVVYYIKELSAVSDVYYMADNEISEDEKLKIAQYTKGAYGFHHKKYDFGSWQELINIISWEEIYKYDEIILANDSCFGPLYKIKPLLDYASQDDCNFWGITTGTREYIHLQSYFIVLKNEVFTSKAFKEFFESVKEYEDKHDIIIFNEIKFTKLLQESGFKAKKLINTQAGLYGEWRTCVKLGIPLLKTAVFKDIHEQHRFQTLIGYDKLLKKYAKTYDIELIDSYIKAMKIQRNYKHPDIKYRLYSIKRALKDFRKWLIQVRIRRKVKIIRLFGFYLINKINGDLEALLTVKSLKKISDN